MASVRHRGVRWPSWGRNALLSCIFLACSYPAHGVTSAALGGQEASAASPTSDFKDYLSKLDVSREESILAARRGFVARFSTARAEVQADAFRLFLEFYREVVRRCDENLVADRNLQKVLHLVTKETAFPEREANRSAVARFRSAAGGFAAKYQRELTQLARYAECGMRFAKQEGDWYLEGDPDFLLESAAPVKSEYMDYLLFRRAEAGQRLVEDAGLMVSWEELARRIFRWELFAAVHPSLPETHTTIEPEIRRMISLYLHGADNTAPYDFSKGGKGAVDAELLESYAAYAGRRPASRYAMLIDGIHELLVASHGLLNKKVLDLLRGAGYEAPRLEREFKRLSGKPPQ